MINGAAAGEDDKSLGWADWDVVGGKEEGGGCWILALLHAVGLGGRCHIFFSHLLTLVY